VGTELATTSCEEVSISVSFWVDLPDSWPSVLESDAPLSSIFWPSVLSSPSGFLFFSSAFAASSSAFCFFAASASAFFFFSASFHFSSLDLDGIIALTRPRISKTTPIDLSALSSSCSLPDFFCLELSSV